jgi:hypothetical protein
MPDVVEQNVDSLAIFTRNWDTRRLWPFATLLNELIRVLEKLAEGKSPMARKIHTILSQIAKEVGEGDKLDYLVANFLPIIAKVPSIPSEHIILNLKHSPYTES